MPGVLQATFYSRDQDDFVDRRQHRLAECPRDATPFPICWTLPTMILSSGGHIRSPSGANNNSTNHHQYRSISVHPLIFHDRVANALGVREGDEVLFSFKDAQLASNNQQENLHCYDDSHSDSSSHDDSYNHYNSSYSNIDSSVTASWIRRDGSSSSNNMDDNLIALRVSIAALAPFDVAIDSQHPACNHIFEGTIHYENFGNFLCLTNGSQWKLNEQERVFRAYKTSKDFRCAGMMLQVEGITDYYNQNSDGAGCGFCIHASSPLAHHPRASEQMVQGYRYLGATSNPHEAVFYALLEGLQWVVRLDFGTVWIVGSSEMVFRQIQGNSCCTGTDESYSDNPKTLQLIQQLKDLLEEARHLRIQFKFLTSNETGEATDLATRAIVQQRNETWCHWSTINFQSQRSMPFNKTLARQVSI
ncbi:expressed unknown protein [Seminavis robusta]|uniref:RNase H type-1 domain-containing protein n=1 Tax=Seminavis robusta TaxID=568900 RepID=A0A9N8HR53_9STRA|nr:expressed unknown protein [Seminavis robusta]|eukprot:Sro1276_g258590.1 n/a (418) ;mRNA; r:18081-19334